MIKRGFNLLIAMMLSLSIILPNVLTPVKGGFLLLALVMVTALHFRGTAHFARYTLITALIYVCAGLLWSLFGLIENNPGAIAVLTVMGAYPLLFTLLASGYKTDDGESLICLFITLALLLGLFNLLYILSFLLMPQNAFQLLIEGIYPDNAVVDAAETYFKFTIPNISSCIFLMPFLIANFIHSSQRRFWSGLAILAMLAIMLLSGRRGFFVAVIAGFLISYIVTFRPSNQFNLKLKLNAQALALLLITLLCLVWFFTSFYGAEFYLSQIKSILNFTTNASNIERALQFDSLMSEIAQSPILGSGAGAAAQYNRSIEQPWAYELVYIGFIFQYGIFGFLLYATGVALLAYHLIAQVRKKGRNSFEFFYLTGFISFMIANSTNPYLATYDYMWVLFIPVAVMNQNLLDKLRRQSNRPG